PNDRSGGVGQRGIDKAKRPTAGLPELPTILSANELVGLLNEFKFELLAPPGKLLNYSNEGFCLLGGVAEQIMQRPYAELVRDMIFAPLQMDKSLIGVRRSQHSDAVALPLLREGSGYRTATFWQAPLFYPAGGCISSARDIARLIGTLDETAPLLGQASKQLLIHQHMSVASRPDPGIGYGLGLEFQQIGSDTTLLWHSGQRAGVSSFMGWLVEEQLAISVLCNVADAPVTGIAHELIGDVLNRTDISWPPAVLMNPAGTRDLETIVGHYASAEGNRYRVEKNDAKLLLTGPAMPHAQQLLFSGPDSGTVGPQTFRFLSTTPHAQPWALALDLRVLRREGES
ncbi:MAG: serine hydrolase domain-containing protein, partial [Sulfitobacter sp.]